MNKYDIDLPGGEQAVLLIHGLTGNPYEMKFLAEKLNKAGFTVSAPCLPGHNQTIEALKNTRWQNWYDRVRERYLGLKQSHHKVGIAGLCMGAVLALELSFEFKEIPAVSLMSTTLFYDGWTIPWYSFLIPLAYYTPVKYIYSFSERPPYGIKNDRLRKIVQKNTATLVYDEVPGVVMDQNFRLISRVKKHMPCIRTPLLLIHANEDDTASVKNADYVQTHVGSTEIRKVLLQNSYHMVTIDNDRMLVAQENIDFFGAKMNF
ncbi:MAG: alpha/beta fold hydrolase [Veillonellales bacterium]